MRRVFNYEKFKNDPKVKEFIELVGDDGFKDCMKSLDGRQVKMLDERVGTIDGFTVYVGWTDPVEKESVWYDILMFAGLGFAVYGLAMFTVQMIELIEGVI